MTANELQKSHPAYVRPSGERAWLLSVWVQPGASKTETVGLYQERLKVKVNAPANDNKANKALCAFVAKSLGLRKNQVGVDSGRTSRKKSLLIQSEHSISWNRLLPGDGANINA
ncbi:MAG: DUF167 domain-containing protein [Desulfovibrio sp.]|uniref:DUF167 domain-containing protein n=1 Tax=Desulfovibrio sp. 7SRBS1 TaxID=3378064 RepID=UPI003B3D88DE